MTTVSRIDLLLQYHKENPEDPFTKYLLALEYIKANLDKEARAWLENIHSNNHDYLPHFYHYGKLLERMGMIKEAVDVYKQGMLLSRNSKDVHAYSELQGALESLEEL